MWCINTERIYFTDVNVTQSTCAELNKSLAIFIRSYIVVLHASQNFIARPPLVSPLSLSPLPPNHHWLIKSENLLISFQFPFRLRISPNISHPIRAPHECCLFMGFFFFCCNSSSLLNLFTFGFGRYVTHMFTNTILYEWEKWRKKHMQMVRTLRMRSWARALAGHHSRLIAHILDAY